MRIKLRKELDFIAKTGLIEFSVEEINGVHVIKEGSFKQNIKSSEYSQIIENKIEEVEKVNDSVKKTARKIAKEKADKAKRRHNKAKPETPKPEKSNDPLEDDF